MRARFFGLTGVSRVAGLSLGLLMLSACATSSTPAPAAKTAASAPAPSYGDPIPADAKLTPVAAVLANPASFDGQTVTLEGKVVKMCKKKGCWFELSDGSATSGILITAPKYNIFLAQGSEGKTVVAAGQFKKEVQDLKEAQHLAEDAGEPVPTEAPVKLRLYATGVNVR